MEAMESPSNTRPEPNEDELEKIGLVKSHGIELDLPTEDSDKRPMPVSYM